MSETRVEIRIRPIDAAPAVQDDWRDRSERDRPIARAS